MGIKAKYKRYGFQEWTAFTIGTIVLCIQVYRYATNTLADNAVEIVVFALAVLLMFSPLTILNLIRKARGLETK